MKLVEPKEAPGEKPDIFDPKDFLAKVGAGKHILEFRKDQHVFEPPFGYYDGESNKLTAKKG